MRKVQGAQNNLKTESPVKAVAESCGFLISGTACGAGYKLPGAGDYFF